MRGRSLAASSSFRTRNGYSGYLSSKAVAASRPGGFSGLIKDKLGIDHPPKR
jgi:hypothetical protein